MNTKLRQRRQLARLSTLAMWVKWEQIVKASLPDKFCADRVYVDQFSPGEEQFVRVARELQSSGAWKYDAQAAMRDAQFGGRVVKIPDYSTAGTPLTRMWLDAQVEIDFLRRNMPWDATQMGERGIKGCAEQFKELDILEIGGGYGRLAVELAPLVHAYFMVDPVPVSRELAKRYLVQFGCGGVTVLSVEEYFDLYNQSRAEPIATEPELKFDLAINIHSWNECSLDTITAWVEEIERLQIPYLFTVSHGQNAAVQTWDLEHPFETPRFKQKSYYSWGHLNPSWRPLLESKYDLVAEENIGLDFHPHALWKRK